MSIVNFAIGHEVAPPPRVSSFLAGTPLPRVYTLQDLLLRLDPPGRPKQHRGLWTAAGHIAQCANMEVADMPVEMLRRVEPEFPIWLTRRRYSPKSVSTFTYYVRKLIQQGDELLGLDGLAEVRQQWKPISEIIEAHKKAPRSVVPFAISQGVGPAVFSETHLTAWAGWMERRGRQHRTIRMAKCLFRQAIKRASIEHLLPMFPCRVAATEYAVPVSQLPEPLKSEVTELIEWKQARFAKGRPQKTRLRPVSAKLLQNNVARLYGFAVNVAEFTGVSSLVELFTEEIVESFMEWALNTRHYKRSSILRFSMLHSALRHHAKYKDTDFSWFLRLCEELPKDDEVAARDRKAQKCVPFDILQEIPVKIRRAMASKRGVEAAWLAHDALVMEWLATLPWRQRNLRECRIGSSEGANVFFGPLPPLKHIAIPASMVEALKRDPSTPLWQFHFRPPETKSDRHVRGILPRNLVRSLEQYLRVHRPLLVGSTDPRTLFLNREGGALDRQVMTDLVGQLTLAHCGVRSTPHVARDAFAYAFLKAFPKDFLSLSKILWHRDVMYTLRIYGSSFDESDGACRVDEWLGDGTNNPADVIH